MKNASIKKMLSLILCVVLIAAMALFTTGCSDTPAETTAPLSGTAEPTVLGEGSKVFPFTIVDRDGIQTVYEIHTDAATVGEALLELELIAGDMGDYGLYVKTVAGQTLDYEADGMYWSFYVDGEYALAGVDLTEITEGASYMFKAEAA